MVTKERSRRLLEVRLEVKAASIVLDWAIDSSGISSSLEKTSQLLSSSSLASPSFSSSSSSSSAILTGATAVSFFGDVC